MRRINFCESCSLDFTVKHDADPEFYPVLHCPFCSGSLNDEEQYILDDEDIELEDE